MRISDWISDVCSSDLLYSYGAYGYAVPPGFSTNRLSLLDRGFAYAVAHIRGGDDLGQQWYLDGKLDKRTNTFNDFVDVAKGLIEHGYTSAGRISIRSEERRVGKECVSTCRSRLSRDH